MNSDERQQLIDSLLDGEISEADFLTLEAALSVDASARGEYYERLALSVLLEVEADARPSSGAPADEAFVAPLSTRRWRRAFSGMATAAALLLATILWMLSAPGEIAPNEAPNRALAANPTEAQAAGFAVVAGQADAVWIDHAALPDGALVPAGRLRLAAGVVQLELFSGVTVVVEGEAEFEILSPLEMTIARGKARAHVPEAAHGFRLRTAEGEVVDLGTDFAVDVSAGRSEVHVLDGEVEWRPHAQGMRPLSTGQAVRWSTDGAGDALAANDQKFIGADELREQLAAARNARRHHWSQYSEDLRRDPRLAVFYQMGDAEGHSRRLANQALAGASNVREGAVREGAIVAAARARDRWGEADDALDFSPTGSRVRLVVPGEHRSLTLFCWVKINSLDRWYNSLFLTDGHDLHEPHWQIMDDGRLFFSVKKRDTWDHSRGEKDKHIYYSPPFWDNSLSGQWLMIATVYNVEAGQVTHYLNGRVLSQEAIPAEYLVEQVNIGAASLGNWGLPERDEPRFAVRNLNGAMDEFALFSAALSHEEIKELYEHGKP